MQTYAKIAIFDYPIPYSFLIFFKYIYPPVSQTRLKCKSERFQLKETCTDWS